MLGTSLAGFRAGEPFVYLTYRKKVELAAAWRAQQEREKNEEITVAFAYWDGSSHRKNLKVKKGHTISQFLTWAIEVCYFMSMLSYVESPYATCYRF